jgi:DNA-binding protein
MSGELNTIFIGRKPPMNYVLAVITSFNMSDTKEVTLKARGQAIATAVDVAEITRSRFLKDLKINKINIGTDTVQQEEGGTRNISTIEITLSI